MYVPMTDKVKLRNTLNWLHKYNTSSKRYWELLLKIVAIIKTSMSSALLWSLQKKVKYQWYYITSQTLQIGIDKKFILSLLDQQLKNHSSNSILRTCGWKRHWLISLINHINDEFIIILNKAHENATNSPLRFVYFIPSIKHFSF